MKRIKKNLKVSLILLFMIQILYMNVYISFSVFLLSFTFNFFNKKKADKEERAMISIQFRDFLLCLLPILNSSKPILHGISEAYEDYVRIYNHTAFAKAIEGTIMNSKINNDVNSVLEEFKRSLNNINVDNFIDNICICNKIGGNINETIRNTTSLIRETIEIEEEIEIILAKKKTEQFILTVMPFCIILIFYFISKEYIQVMYESLIGRVVMTLSAILFFLQYIICNKLADIRMY